jgi:hypothetical protein
MAAADTRLLEGPLMPGTATLRGLAQRVMGKVDVWYNRRHGLQPVGQVLLVGRVRYRGPQLRFPDGTLLRTDDMIGQLHFSNLSISALGRGGTQLTGFRFARLMRESLRLLAQTAHSDPVLSAISVFRGITWLPAHGNVVGFISEPLSRTWRNWWLGPYFRLLSWVFSPSLRSTRERRSSAPRIYWLTRVMLAQNLNKLAKGGDRDAAAQATERVV